MVIRSDHSRPHLYSSSVWGALVSLARATVAVDFHMVLDFYMGVGARGLVSPRAVSVILNNVSEAVLSGKRSPLLRSMTN